MIESLLIENFPIIRRAHIRWMSGMAVITGETGAGKSLLINAIQLLSGKSVRSVGVRDGAAQASVALEVSLDDSPAGRAWLKRVCPEIFAVAKDSSRVELRRVISAKGRSQASINGASVTLAQLAELTALVVEVCGQNTHHALAQTDRHLDILDRQCGHEQAVRELAKTARQWRDAREQIDELKRRAAKMESQRALLTYQIEELDAIAPEENEWQTLSTEHRTLSRSEQLLQLCGNTIDLLSDDETGMQSRLAQIVREMETFDTPQIKSVARQLDEALIIAQSATSDLRQIVDSADLSNKRLNEVEARLTQLSDVARKHHVEPSDLFAHWHRMRQSLLALKQSSESLGELEREEEALRQRWREIAERVSAARRKTAAALEQDVMRELANLAMPRAVFQIVLTPIESDEVANGESDKPIDDDATTFESDEANRTAKASPLPNARGLEHAAFHIQTNPGSPMRLLRKVASGGEMSRINLALRVAMANKYPVPTLIFDEVENGIGGATAETVGELLKRLSRHAQVLCITHLAQIASQAEHHYHIEKRSSKTETDIALTRLERDERDREIARMMGGKTVTEQSLAHARELLNRNAGKARGNGASGEPTPTDADTPAPRRAPSKASSNKKSGGASKKRARRNGRKLTSKTATSDALHD